MLEVQIIPNAGKNQIAGWHGGRIKIKIKAPPVDGKANEELVRYLAEALGVHRRDIVIERGETGRSKTISIAGMSDSEALSRLGVQIIGAE
jgi:hypothetical protein